MVCFCSRCWLEPCAAMLPPARSRSHTPPTRGFWDREAERERFAEERKRLALERNRLAEERERELREQDAMFCEDPHTLEWWITSRETSAMAAHDDWYLLFPCFRNMPDW